jgi:HAE1 family hydrophobic/amphiphilic exporter-1
MLAATILTLLFVPVFYAVIEGLRERGDSTEEVHPSEPGHVPAE